MVDLRKEFKKIIDENGSYYLLVRNNKKQPCKCIDTLYNTPNDKCPICLGTGYINKVEKIKGRVVTASIPETLPRAMVNAEPGELIVPSKQFYLSYNIMPKKKDLLVICKWAGLKPIFNEFSEIYEINYSDLLRGENGRVEYIIAHCKGDPINAKLKFHSITTNANKLTYYITVGDKNG